MPNDKKMVKLCKGLSNYCHLCALVSPYRQDDFCLFPHLGSTGKENILNNSFAPYFFLSQKEIAYFISKSIISIRPYAENMSYLLSIQDSQGEARPPSLPLQDRWCGKSLKQDLHSLRSSISAIVGLTRQTYNFHACVKLNVQNLFCNLNYQHPILGDERYQI